MSRVMCCHESNSEGRWVKAFMKLLQLQPQALLTLCVVHYLRSKTTILLELVRQMCKHLSSSRMWRICAITKKINKSTAMRLAGHSWRIIKRILVAFNHNWISRPKRKTGWEGTGCKDVTFLKGSGEKRKRLGFKLLTVTMELPTKTSTWRKRPLSVCPRAGFCICYWLPATVSTPTDGIRESTARFVLW